MRGREREGDTVGWERERGMIQWGRERESVFSNVCAVAKETRKL